MEAALTFSIDEGVYRGLLAMLGRGRIGLFIEGLARPLVVPQNLDAAYREMASDNEREGAAVE